MTLSVPLASWVKQFVDWLETFEAFFEAVSRPLNFLVTSLEGLLLTLPVLVVIAVFAVLAWRLLNWKVAIFTVLSLLLLYSTGIWEKTMTTLAIVIVATLMSVITGVPVGILASRSNSVEGVVRPILDFMQTMPSFVYLIPALILFGIGKVPAVIATLIFSMPPAVRLTSLGIRQVPAEVVEAGRAFGATPGQLLFKVQLPMALPTIMAGINQTLMLALSMAVIAGMIGAGGLGGVVYFSISRVDVGTGFVGGLGIVILAIILDRLTQAMARRPADRQEVSKKMGEV